MITVTIWRKTLVRHGVCASALALFDRIAAMQPESDPRRLRRIRIMRWGALHWIMLVQAGHGEWLAARGIVPRVNLYGSDLRDANLAHADLRCANLRCANLRNANLTAAKLTRADLRAADLAGANLTGANLTGANLTNAKLDGANLTGAYRGHDQPPIPGWCTDAEGYLEREKVTRGH